MSMFKPNKPDTTIDVEDFDIPFVIEPPEPEPISVVTLAAELGESIDTLVGRLGDDLFIETQTGLRCVTVAVCRREVDELARQTAERDRAAREHYDAMVAREAAEKRTVAPDPHLQSLAATGMESRR